jgi:hypothetical protein
MIDGDSHHWRQLCQIALLETDPVDFWYASLDARFVILDRSEDYHSDRTANVPRYGTHWRRQIICAG